MRIAHVVHKFPPESIGGTEIYTWSLTRHLAAQGHEVHVFFPSATRGGPERSEDKSGLKLWRAPASFAESDGGLLRRFWSTFRSYRIEDAFSHFLEDARPDVVHFQHVQGVSARLLSMTAGRPSVLTLHDYWYYCANSQLLRYGRTPCEGSASGWPCGECGSSKAGLGTPTVLRPLLALPFVFRNWYLRLALKNVSLFIAPSEFLREQYVQAGFPAEKIITVGHGLDSERLLLEPGAASRRRSGAHFGYLGSIAWQKGVHVLVTAFNRLPEIASLTVYGDPSVFPDYAAHLRALVDHPRIRFAGPLDYQRVGDALRELDYLVMPSLWYENYPLVIQEAFALGVPVVASRLGALTERVRDGENGRLFEPGDDADLSRVMSELIRAPELRDAYNATIESEPTMAEHADRMTEIYRSLLERSG